MGRAKNRNSKKTFMREHDCRFCLYYGSCAHKECVFDGSESSERESADVRTDIPENDVGGDDVI